MVISFTSDGLERLLNITNKFVYEIQQPYSDLTNKHGVPTEEESELGLDIGSAIINRSVNVVMMNMNHQIKIANKYVGSMGAGSLMQHTSTFLTPSKIIASLMALKRLLKKIEKISGDVDAEKYIQKTKKHLEENLKVLESDWQFEDHFKKKKSNKKPKSIKTKKHNKARKPRSKRPTAKSYDGGDMLKYFSYDEEYIDGWQYFLEVLFHFL